jgi:hypothetical protein
VQAKSRAIASRLGTPYSTERMRRAELLSGGSAGLSPRAWHDAPAAGEAPTVAWYQPSSASPLVSPRVGAGIDSDKPPADTFRVHEVCSRGPTTSASMSLTLLCRGLTHRRTCCSADPPAPLNHLSSLNRCILLQALYGKRYAVAIKGLRNAATHPDAAAAAAAAAVVDQYRAELGDDGPPSLPPSPFAPPRPLAHRVRQSFPGATVVAKHIDVPSLRQSDSDSREWLASDEVNSRTHTCASSPSRLQLR